MAKAMCVSLIVGILSLYVFHATVHVLCENGQGYQYGPLSFSRSVLRVPLHTYIFAGWSRNTSKQGFSQEEKDELLTLHNELRKQVPAAGMRRLHWNTTLELAAQAWTEGCDFQHNYGTDYGENLSAQPYFYNGSEAILGWYSEIAYYDYTTNSCSDGHICGHYTQLVLEESSNVGCGIYFCRTMKTITMTNGYFIACFYSPATNKGSSVPYKNGPVCSSCLAGLGCVDGLCDEESPIKVKDPKCPSLVGFPKVLFVSGSQLCREVKSNQTETATTP